MTHAFAPVGYGRMALLCGSVTAAIGVLVLTGWWLDMAVLKIPPPGNVAMKANTALAFALAGAALVLLAGVSAAPRRVRAGRWLALAVVLIGGLTLCQFLFGWQLGIDELLFKDVPGVAAPSGAGRMAPLTATCFVLLGLALIGIDWEPRPGFRSAEWLALIAAIMSLIALGEYAIGQPVFFGFDRYTRMALLTAASFLVLSSGVLLARPSQGVVAALRAGRISAQEQAIYAALGLALLAAAGGGAWYYHAQEQQERRVVAAELEVIARLKVEQIVQWRAERLADGAVLMESEFFADGVWRWMAEPRAELEEKIRRRLDVMLRSNRYQDAVLVDIRGQVRLATSDKAAALHEEEFQPLARALRDRRLVLSDLHTTPSAPMPHANLVVPLFRKVGAALAPVGAVVLTIDAQQFLYPLIQLWPTPSFSAETLLVSRDGDDALFINDIRHHPDAALKLRIPLNRTEVPAVMAVLGKEGVFEGYDYRGVKVLSVLRAIPDSPWFMVTKIDEAEALAAWRYHATLIVTVIVALMLALAAATSMVWQQKSKYRALSSSAAALRESEELFRSAMQYSTIGMALVAPDGRWLEINDAVCEMLGYSRDELLATNFQAITHPDDLNADLEQVRAMLEGRITNYHMEKRYLHKTGRIVWALLGVSLVRHADGRARNFISHIRDITERKQAEEEIRALGATLEQRVQERTESLRQARERLDFLLRATPTTIYAAKAGGDYPVTFMSANVRAMLGWEAEDFLREPAFWSSNIHPDDREHVFARLAALETEDRQTLEYRFRHRDGSWPWLHDDFILIRDSSGAPHELIGYLLDVTEQKRAQAAVADALRMKSDFMANVTHELRTPLNSVIGFAELLKDEVPGPLNAQQAQFAADILASGQQLLALVEGILEMSRLEAVEAALEREPVAIGVAIEERIAAHRKAAEARGVTMGMEVAADVGSVQLDPMALHRMLDALLDNAVKFNREAGTVRVSAQRADGMLEIAVADTGIGIASADLPKLFQPLVQLDATLARKYGGIGLGLALAQRLAQRHGGIIEVKSEPGRGSTFTLRLPIQEETT